MQRYELFSIVVSLKTHFSCKKAFSLTFVNKSTILLTYVKNVKL